MMPEICLRGDTACRLELRFSLRMRNKAVSADPACDMCNFE